MNPAKPKMRSLIRIAIGVGIFYSRRWAPWQCRPGYWRIAKSAVPALVQALKGKDKSVYEGAIKALGNIHSDPDVVIPLLISFLDNDDLNDEAATALAGYGPLAKVAVPKIIPLLQAADDDAQAAAQDALLKIDHEAAEKAGVKKK